MLIRREALWGTEARIPDEPGVSALAALNATRLCGRTLEFGVLLLWSADIGLSTCSRVIVVILNMMQRRHSSWKPVRHGYILCNTV